MAVHKFDVIPRETVGGHHEYSYDDENRTITLKIVKADGAVESRNTRYLSQDQLIQLKKMGPVQTHDAMVVYSDASTDKP